ncbi:beta-ketoacyl synthase N-terminal-like domain-containing protein [Corallococcus terminator]|uniref:Uncharacterized protein n=1 Tax=Corallococcus terminator TaxID=2316733 RepID=A0A3A8IQP4_9BACT|nr:beta-ketoacyl synthase N-terminal-like domain-containing protein [Corallococcus terminator]RKG85799.1 hypothetical protein D7V88_19170 [Corallococcus terminator]
MRLAITGLGMLSTLGEDVISACAALRCGMARPAPLRFEVYSEDDEEGVERVVGHPLQGITNGFEGLGLYTLMAAHALNDLVCYAGLDRRDKGFWASTALFSCLSRPRMEDLGATFEELLEERLVASVLAETQLPAVAGRGRRFMSGHASVLEAIHEARQELQSGRVRRVIVLAVDSLVGDDDVMWLAQRGMLKTTQRPVGMMPGQAAVALLLEGESEARRRGARVEAFIEAVHVGREPDSRERQQPGTGQALAGVLARSLEGRPGIADAYGDLNGQETRAREWGNALVRLSGTHDLPVAPRCPATSLGDTGSASGAIAIAAATRSLLRGYARGTEVLVWSSSDSGEVASALVVQNGSPGHKGRRGA